MKSAKYCPLVLMSSLLLTGCGPTLGDFTLAGASLLLIGVLYNYLVLVRKVKRWKVIILPILAILFLKIFGFILGWMSEIANKIFEIKSTIWMIYPAIITAILLLSIAALYHCLALAKNIRKLILSAQSILAILALVMILQAVDSIFNIKLVYWIIDPILSIITPISIIFEKTGLNIDPVVIVMIIIPTAIAPFIIYTEIINALLKSIKGHQIKFYVAPAIVALSFLSLALQSVDSSEYFPEVLIMLFGWPLYIAQNFF